MSDSEEEEFRADTHSSLVFCEKVCMYCTLRANQVGEIERKLLGE